ncbi:MAG: hypothetical protein IPK16_07120 [Anaerolineales bacterium]|nr:hypothetical protein [Anaerolineales bacterium]
MTPDMAMPLSLRSPWTVGGGCIDDPGHGHAVVPTIALDGGEGDASITTDTAMPMSTFALDGGEGDASMTPDTAVQ